MNTRKAKNNNDSFRKYLKQAEKPVATKNESQNINYNFILGNVAEVERLWNIAGYILRNERASMGAEKFEAQLFLNTIEIYRT